MKDFNNTIHYVNLIDKISDLAVTAADTQLQLIRIEKKFNEHVARENLLIEKIQESFTQFKLEIDKTIKTELATLKDLK